MKNLSEKMNIEFLGEIQIVQSVRETPMLEDRSLQDNIIQNIMNLNKLTIKLKKM